MAKIILKTPIKSSMEIVFDLSRSIDLHKISTSKTNEEAIAGVTEGLISLNETVTWQATHFYIKQKLTTAITQFDSPNSFTDEMTKGIFKSMVHTHTFTKTDYGTEMVDIFIFESPFGLLGKIVNYMILTKYMTRLLETRNQVIKDFAESEKWKDVLGK